MFEGLGVAIVTPFRKDGSIDYKAVEKLAEHLIQGGVDYLVVLGTTGESATLSADEKKKLVRYLVEYVDGRVPLVVGFGGNNTDALVRQAGDFDFSGISGILSVAPYYNKPNQRGLYRHYETLAAALPAPVILYNVPGRTGVNLLPETVLSLARNVENIVAVKEASGNMEQIMSIAKEKPEGFQLISGDDALTLPLMAAGGNGVISVLANAWPAECKKMIAAAGAGDFATANKIHHRFMKMISLLFADGNPGGIKAVLAEMGLIENHLRLPLVPVSDRILQMIRDEMKNL